jgi:hypothetical protein
MGLEILRTRRVSSVIIPLILLLLGMLALTAFGFLGVGREGSFAFDMPYLYVAGEMWKDHLSPYELDDFRLHMASLADVESERYAYPPNSTVLALVLSIGSLDSAKFLMGALNVTAILFLAFFIYYGARRSERDDAAKHGDSTLLTNLLVASAVVIGNPFAAHVVWMGQTTLISAACLLGSWLLADRRKDLLAGVILGVAAFKPQLAFLVGIWFLLDRRWLLLSSATVTTIVLSSLPIVTAGLDGSWFAWLRSIGEYQSSPHNVVSSEHVFGVRSLLASMGVDSPSLMPLALIFTFLLYLNRQDYDNVWIVAAVLLISLLFIFSHDYDLAPAMIIAYPILKTSADRRSLFAGVVALAFVIMVPQRLWESVDLEELGRTREVAVLGLLGVYLVFCRVRRNRVGQGSLNGGLMNRLNPSGKG